MDSFQTIGTSTSLCNFFYDLFARNGKLYRWRKRLIDRDLSFIRMWSLQRALTRKTLKMSLSTCFGDSSLVATTTYAVLGTD